MAELRAVVELCIETVRHTLARHPADEPGRETSLAEVEADAPGLPRRPATVTAMGLSRRATAVVSAALALGACSDAHPQTPDDAPDVRGSAQPERPAAEPIEPTGPTESASSPSPDPTSRRTRVGR